MSHRLNLPPPSNRYTGTKKPTKVINAATTHLTGLLKSSGSNQPSSMSDYPVTLEPGYRIPSTFWDALADLGTKDKYTLIRNRTSSGYGVTVNIFVIYLLQLAPCLLSTNHHAVPDKTVLHPSTNPVIIGQNPAKKGKIDYRNLKNEAATTATIKDNMDNKLLNIDTYWKWVHEQSDVIWLANMDEFPNLLKLENEPTTLYNERLANAQRVREVIYLFAKFLSNLMLLFPANLDTKHQLFHIDHVNSTTHELDELQYTNTVILDRMLDFLSLMAKEQVSSLATENGTCKLLVSMFSNGHFTTTALYSYYEKLYKNIINPETKKLVTTALRGFSEKETRDAKGQKKTVYEMSTAYTAIADKPLWHHYNKLLAQSVYKRSPYTGHMLSFPFFKLIADSMTVTVPVTDTDNTKEITDDDIFSRKEAPLVNYRTSTVGFKRTMDHIRAEYGDNGYNKNFEAQTFASLSNYGKDPIMSESVSLAPNTYKESVLGKLDGPELEIGPHDTMAILFLNMLPVFTIMHANRIALQDNKLQSDTTMDIELGDKDNKNKTTKTSNLPFDSSYNLMFSMQSLIQIIAQSVDIVTVSDNSSHRMIRYATGPSVLDENGLLPYVTTDIARFAETVSKKKTNDTNTDTITDTYMRMKREADNAGNFDQLTAAIGSLLVIKTFKQDEAYTKPADYNLLDNKSYMNACKSIYPFRFYPGSIFPANNWKGECITMFIRINLLKSVCSRDWSLTVPRVTTLKKSGIGNMGTGNEMDIEDNNEEDVGGDNEHSGGEYEEEERREEGKKPVKQHIFQATTANDRKGDKPKSRAVNKSVKDAIELSRDNENTKIPNSKTINKDSYYKLGIPQLHPPLFHTAANGTYIVVLFLQICGNLGEWPMGQKWDTDGDLMIETMPGKFVSCNPPKFLSDYNPNNTYAYTASLISEDLIYQPISSQWIKSMIKMGVSIKTNHNNRRTDNMDIEGEGIKGGRQEDEDKEDNEEEEEEIQDRDRNSSPDIDDEEEEEKGEGEGEGDRNNNESSPSNRKEDVSGSRSGSASVASRSRSGSEMGSDSEDKNNKMKRAEGVSMSEEDQLEGSDIISTEGAYQEITYNKHDDEGTKNNKLMTEFNRLFRWNGSIFGDNNCATLNQFNTSLLALNDKTQIINYMQLIGNMWQRHFILFSLLMNWHSMCCRLSIMIPNQELVDLINQLIADVPKHQVTRSTVRDYKYDGVSTDINKDERPDVVNDTTTNEPDPHARDKYRNQLMKTVAKNMEILDRIQSLLVDHRQLLLVDTCFEPTICGFVNLVMWYRHIEDVFSWNNVQSFMWCNFYSLTTPDGANNNKIRFGKGSNKWTININELNDKYKTGKYNSMTNPSAYNATPMSVKAFNPSPAIMELVNIFADHKARGLKNAIHPFAYPWGTDGYRECTNLVMTIKMWQTSVYGQLVKRYLYDNVGEEERKDAKYIQTQIDNQIQGIDQPRVDTIGTVHLTDWLTLLKGSPGPYSSIYFPPNQNIYDDFHSNLGWITSINASIKETRCNIEESEKKRHQLYERMGQLLNIQGSIIHSMANRSTTHVDHGNQPFHQPTNMVHLDDQLVRIGSKVIDKSDIQHALEVGTPFNLLKRTKANSRYANTVLDIFAGHVKSTQLLADTGNLSKIGRSMLSDSFKRILEESTDHIQYGAAPRKKVKKPMFFETAVINTMATKVSKEDDKGDTRHSKPPPTDGIKLTKGISNIEMTKSVMLPTNEMTNKPRTTKATEFNPVTNSHKPITISQYEISKDAADKRNKDKKIDKKISEPERKKGGNDVTTKSLTGNMGAKEQPTKSQPQQLISKADVVAKGKTDQIGSGHKSNKDTIPKTPGKQEEISKGRDNSSNKKKTTK